ncbi:MAG: hypothetical protein CL759_04450 [Chloroflexi bacterium]|nr:hypothetical protein [Chloroflexota bacterium]
MDTPVFSGGTLNQTLSKARIMGAQRRYALVLAMAVALLFAACGGSTNGDTQVIDQNEQNGDLAPDFLISMFQGQDVVGGQDINFHDLTGEKPIVLNFWAGLCPPCRAEMPDLQEFSNEYEDRALLLGIDLGQFTGLGNLEDAQELLNDLGVSYPAGYTEDDQVIRNYKVLGMPTTVFINADGTIHDKWTGALTRSTLEEKTDEMLAR